ncbi:unnamed protein product [Mytilus edulis]|uniref:Integrase catalytic domain-containing protein n=1 Tax=Mytilus edulis TaxID=6550 RepID=A0A8S3V4E1_MYTED|nr:unnamed protein product [Mytilus edulis]
MKTNNVLSKPDSRLKSFSGHNIECDGKITLPVTLKNQKHEVEFYVANTKSQSVLGAATCSEVGLIKRVYTLEAKYSDLFTGLGCLPGIHKIHETVEKLVPDIEINEIQLNAHLPISPEKYELFKKQTESDEILQQMKKINENPWPLKKEELPEDLKMYWQFRNEITCIDNLLYKGLKLIIPTSLRKEMLQLIHETHMGIVKCKTRAREFMYWPGMMSDIQDIVEKCETCAINNKKTNNKEPMITSKLPDRPSSKLAADLFQYKGEHYLLTVDYYSKWPEIDKLDELSSSNTICYLKKQMSRFGYIDQLITDNGPQFACREFAHGKPLRELKDNETVMIEHNNQLTPGKVVRKHETPRSYIVETLGRTRLRRNRKHLKTTRATFQPEMEIEQHLDVNTPQQEIRNDPITENFKQATEINKPVQNQETQIERKSVEPTCSTRSGRSVKVPIKYNDYVCNSISVNSEGKEIYV